MSRARRLSAVVSAASAGIVLAVSVLAGPALGQGVTDKTIPTLPPSSSTSTPPAAAAEPTGIAIAAGARLDQIVRVVHEITGDTPDLGGELAQLAPVPDGILSPGGASVDDISVEYDAGAATYRASATFRSDASAEDAVVFYVATLTAMGFTPTFDDIDEGDATTYTLRFDAPATDRGTEIEVRVSDGVADDISITVAGPVDTRVLQAFTGWALGMPEIHTGEPVGARLEATATPLSLTISTRFAYPGRTADELNTTLRAGLPAPGFAIDATLDDGGLQIPLRHTLLTDLLGELSDDADSGAAILLLTGTVRL